MSWDVPMMRNAFLRVQKEIKEQILISKKNMNKSRFLEVGGVEYSTVSYILPTF